jgi:hypothetical protein
MWLSTGNLPKSVVTGLNTSLNSQDQGRDLVATRSRPDHDPLDQVATDVRYPVDSVPTSVVIGSRYQSRPFIMPLRDAGPTASRYYREHSR